MPTELITISRQQYNQLLAGINDILQHLIVDNVVEYEYLGEVANGGLTPNMRVNLWEHFNTAYIMLFGNNHPIIVKKLVSNTVFSLGAAVYGLFSIRDKATFTPNEIKQYLYKHLEHLLDLDSSSLLGEHISIIMT